MCKDIVKLWLENHIHWVAKLTCCLLIVCLLYICISVSVFVYCNSFLFCTESSNSLQFWISLYDMIHVHVHLFRMLQRPNNNWKNAKDILQVRIMNCWQLIRNLRRWDLKCYCWRRHWLKREGRKWRKKLNSAQCKGNNYVYYITWKWFQF